tara:strand:- start:466 stop:639 length:174 start_codon:yes stop_codon:yes gene_type:complete
VIQMRDIFDTIALIKTGTSEQSRKAWMETISNRNLALKVLRLLGPFGRKKLTEDIRS